MTAEENQGEEDRVAGDGADSAGEGVAPTTDYAAADGQHVERAHRRGGRQSHEVCGRKYVDVGDEHHVTVERLNGKGLGLDIRLSSLPYFGAVVIMSTPLSPLNIFEFQYPRILHQQSDTAVEFAGKFR
ncbi:MAG: hypothetical protein ABSH01_14815 [Terriglobia bacterium]